MVLIKMAGRILAGFIDMGRKKMYGSLGSVFRLEDEVLPK
jgi:hypothetical protein